MSLETRKFVNSIRVFISHGQACEPLKTAIKRLTNNVSDNGSYCAATVIDLVAACKKLLRVVYKLEAELTKYQERWTAMDLGNIITPSTAHMSEAERRAGIAVMLADLERLSREDGCIAAAWALEVLETIQEHKT